MLAGAGAGDDENEAMNGIVGIDDRDDPDGDDVAGDDVEGATEVDEAALEPFRTYSGLISLSFSCVLAYDFCRLLSLGAS